jgi:spermidine/putrescine-binding protein
MQKSLLRLVRSAFILFVALYVNCGSPQKRQLNLYIWSAYVSQDILTKFEDQTGIHVNFDTFDSNQTLLEKVRSGAVEYDLVCPTDWLINSLIKLELIQKLDPNRLPGRKNLMPKFANPPYDPGNAYAIPFVWGTSGIGYNKTKVSDAIDSWDILWNPRYKGRIGMLDSPGDCFQVALKRLGYSINVANPLQIQEAAELLAQQKPLVKVYNSSNFDEFLLNGDLWLVFGWSGLLARAMEQNRDLDYVVPKEGSLLWMDSLAILKTAPHVEEAYEFLNFCLDPKVAAQITTVTGYANPNEAAKAHLNPALLNNPARYPDEETLLRCEWSKDQPEVDKIKDRYWTEIKSR